MNELNVAIMTATKHRLIQRKAAAVRTRVQMGDLTIKEAGTELKVYLDRLDRFRSLEDLDKWLNGRQKQNNQS